MNRNKLAAEAEIYRKGLEEGDRRTTAMWQTKMEKATLENGIDVYESYERGRTRERKIRYTVEWQRLTKIAIFGGFIGSILALSLAAVVITIIYYITV